MNHDGNEANPFGSNCRLEVCDGKKVTIFYTACTRAFTFAILLQLQLTEDQVEGKTNSGPSWTFCPDYRYRVSISSNIADIIFLSFTSSVLEHIVNEYICRSVHGWEFSHIAANYSAGAHRIHGLHASDGASEVTMYCEKKDVTYHYSPTASRISWNRFTVLGWYLYISQITPNLQHHTGYSKLGKIQPIIIMRKISCCVESGTKTSSSTK